MGNAKSGKTIKTEYISSAYRGPLCRRTFLRVGALATGLGLGNLLRLRAAADAGQVDTSVILLWLAGGPSHLETYDLKPDAGNPKTGFKST
jgi:hypothetical protein